MSSKGTNVLKFLLLFLVIAGIGYGIYQYYIYGTLIPPQEGSCPIKNNDSNLTLYDNHNVGFCFLYPKSYLKEEDTPGTSVGLSVASGTEGSNTIGITANPVEGLDIELEGELEDRLVSIKENHIEVQNNLVKRMNYSYETNNEKMIDFAGNKGYIFDSILKDDKQVVLSESQEVLGTNDDYVFNLSQKSSKLSEAEMKDFETIYKSFVTYD